MAVHAVNRARFAKGGTAAVAGAGTIGLLTMQAFKAAGGGRVVCLDINENRLKFALEMGADETINPARSSGLENIAETVFETAGSDAATSSLFQYAKPGGCVVQVGWPGSNIVPMDIARFIEKELDYVGVNRYANAFGTAIKWIRDKKIDVKKIITHKFSFDRITEAFDFTWKNPQDVIKTVVMNEI